MRKLLEARLSAPRQLVEAIDAELMVEQDDPISEPPFAPSRH
jgi:hypothetical protein